MYDVLLVKTPYTKNLFYTIGIICLLFIALCYTDAGLTGEAIKVYCDLLQIDPKNAQAHSNLGRLFMAEGDYESAIKHYNTSIELKANNYFPYVNRAKYTF